MCSNVITLLPWDLDISEFKTAEKKVADNFIFGVIELGRILKEKRDKYKPKGEWMKYLEEIDKSMAGANQFVRLYEYAEKHKKDFYELNLTNWERINKFLALPEALRLQLAKEISGQNISDEDFKENLKKIKGEMPEEELKTTPKIIVDNIIRNSIFDEIIKELRKNISKLNKKEKEEMALFLEVGIKKLNKIINMLKK